MRGNLRDFLIHRLPNEPERVEAALALLDDERMLGKVADERLRVGLVALTGTLAEPAIETFLNEFLLLEFAPVENANGESNTALDAAGVPRQHVRVSERHQHEHFALLSVLLSHEILHEDARRLYLFGQRLELFIQLRSFAQRALGLHQCGRDRVFRFIEDIV